jgi:hypothetical protein
MYLCSYAAAQRPIINYAQIKERNKTNTYTQAEVKTRQFVSF